MICLVDASSYAVLLVLSLSLILHQRFYLLHTIQGISDHIYVNKIDRSFSNSLSF